uniref:aa3-type cytochrome oxidase subunit II n=1 Tax=Nigerium massiliense TaxID=1522317 RepID=UPI000590040D
MKGRVVGLRLRKPGVRAALVAAGAATTLALTGCSQATMEQWGRAGLPEAASDRAPFIGNLWVGAWIASMTVGVLVWGLIFWCIGRYKRKHHNELPRQTRYNVPLEFLYTLVPLIIVGVLFFFTVLAQDGVNRKVDKPDHTVEVIGQKWSWTFNYMESDNPRVGAVVHEVGTLEKIPELVLPVNQSVRFNLHSADVIHSFWIPDFYYKLDVIPGRVNSFDVTPTKEGTFLGKCAELCGTYHAAMVFNVRVVSAAEYDQYLAQLKSKGATGEIKAPSFPTTGPVLPKEHEG